MEFQLGVQTSCHSPYYNCAAPEKKKPESFFSETHAATNIGRILAPLRRAPSPRTTTTRLGWESKVFLTGGSIRVYGEPLQVSRECCWPLVRVWQEPAQTKVWREKWQTGMRLECSLSWQDVVAAGQHLPAKGWLSESCWCWLSSFTRCVICALFSILVPEPLMVSECLDTLHDTCHVDIDMQPRTPLTNQTCSMQPVHADTHLLDSYFRLD